MLRVMIVEDEMLIRMGIRMSCDWESLGFQIVAEEENGQRAWERITQEAPDILLLDLKIPKLSGIDLLRRLRGINSECRVIIISSHKEFDYLHEAMTLGITDYLLKVSLTGKEIARALEKAKNELMEMGTAFRQPMQRQTDDFQPAWAVVFCPKIPDRVSDIMLGALREMITTNLEKFAPLRVESVHGGQCVCLLGKRPDDMEAFRRAALYICTYFETLFRLRLYAAGMPHTQDAAAAAKTLSAKSDGGYWRWDACVEIESEIGAQGAKRAWEECMARAEKEAFISGPDKEMFLGYMNEARTARSRDEWENALIALCDHFIRNYGSSRQISEISRRIMRASSALQAFDVVLALYRENVCCLLPLETLREEIRSAANYVATHYMYNISAKDAAQHVVLSSNYFSNLFSQETGMTFSNYVMRYRVEKAKQLMENPAMSGDEIASMCGFSDASHFSRTFRKVEGMSASEYRRRKEEKQE